MSKYDDILDESIQDIEDKEEFDKVFIEPAVKKQAKKRLNVGRLLVFVGVAALLAGAAVFLIVKLTPTSRVMTGFEYFDVNEGAQGNEYLVILDDEVVKDTGIMVDGRLYFTREFTYKNLNKRFYYDSDSDSILVTNLERTLCFKAGENVAADETGKQVDNGYPVVIKQGDTWYIAAEYAAVDGGFTMEMATQPQRVIITVGEKTKEVVTVTEAADVRYRGGIKSPILAKVNPGDELFYSKDVGDWYEVRTKDGFKGYVKSDCVSAVSTKTVGRNATDYIGSRDNKETICLTWYQMTSVSGNDGINMYYTGVECTNVLSPTWFSITDNDGSMKFIGDKSLVDKMHAKGIKVWALCDDFSKSIDRTTFLGSKAVRKRIIDTLVNNCLNCGVDGINIDFENISKENSEHYLQFLRELSVVCHAKNLVLSTDNYIPYSFRPQYEVGEQSAYVDYLIFMGYDEHTGSDEGSVASLPFVEEGIKLMLEKGVPKDALVLGMPFYTRVWEITAKETKGTAVTMQRALDVLNEAGAVAQWNEECSQYFGSYQNGDKTVMIWLEEERSLEEKLKMMEKYDIAGCAQWKLGQERKSVWNVIKKYVK